MYAIWFMNVLSYDNFKEFELFKLFLIVLLWRFSLQRSVLEDAGSNAENIHHPPRYFIDVG